MSLREWFRKKYISKDTPLVAYEFFAQLKTFEVVEFSPGSTMYRVPVWDHDRSVLILSRLQDGYAFAPHYHDCKEVIHIKQGCYVLNNRKYISGDQVIIQPFVEHSGYVEGETVLTAEIIKP